MALYKFTYLLKQRQLVFVPFVIHADDVVRRRGIAITLSPCVWMCMFAKRKTLIGMTSNLAQSVADSGPLS